MVIFRSISPGKFYSGPAVMILPPTINEGGVERRQPGTGFGYAVCAVDLNNDG